MDAVTRFAELAGQPDPPLDRAALALAAGADPALDPAPWLAQLDRLAAGVGSLDAAAAPVVRAGGLRRQRAQLPRPAQLAAQPRAAPPARDPDHASPW